MVQGRELHIFLEKISRFISLWRLPDRECLQIFPLFLAPPFKHDKVRTLKNHTSHTQYSSGTNLFIFSWMLSNIQFYPSAHVTFSDLWSLSHFRTHYNRLQLVNKVTSIGEEKRATKCHYSILTIVFSILIGAALNYLGLGSVEPLSLP